MSDDFTPNERQRKFSYICQLDIINEDYHLFLCPRFYFVYYIVITSVHLTHQAAQG